MPAFWSGPVAGFLAAEPAAIVAELARHQVWHFRTTEAEQSPAWAESIATLRTALSALGRHAQQWWLLLEYPMLRLSMRIDALLLTDRAILVLEFKRQAADIAALRQAEDYALNLRDFHSASRAHPIVPIVVSEGANAARNPRWLFWDAVPPVQQTPPAELGAFLGAMMDAIGAPPRPLDPLLWLAGAYCPVPTIIEAARMTYARHGVEEIRQARAGQTNLRETAACIRTCIDTARAEATKVVLFVTGIPGAGKTLCGLDTTFSGDRADATFLTGNPTLVHVLREALVRDAVGRNTERRVAAPRINSRIQRLPDFRNEYVQYAQRTPPERVAVIDEAQRCWSCDYAIRKTRDKPIRLTDSEPGHLLDILGRHTGFAACVCLVGSGQEIHDGEGGLAEWGLALRARPEWQVLAPDDVLHGDDPRWVLGELPHVRRIGLLHLQVAIRQIRSTVATRWVDAVLRGDAAGAAALADHSDAVPFRVTRSLDDARRAVRARARGARRAGMIASSGGKRLRAEGLGAELPHMDAGAVARWFLDSFPPDVRACDALEQVATEFSCQGLELDYALLCWDADLCRATRGTAWVARRFKGTRWQYVREPEANANQLNTYRVLLTRARYETIIFIPNGDHTDPTRPPADYDRIADFLLDCGAAMLSEIPARAAWPELPEVPPAAQPVLL
jgi:hypothetical protein